MLQKIIAIFHKEIKNVILDCGEREYDGYMTVYNPETITITEKELLLIKTKTNTNGIKKTIIITEWIYTDENVSDISIFCSVFSDLVHFSIDFICEYKKHNIYIQVPYNKPAQKLRELTKLCDELGIKWNIQIPKNVKIEEE